MATCAYRYHLDTFARIRRLDPTHTTPLRAAFAKNLKNRFAKFVAIIEKAVVADDCFGLNPTPFTRILVQAEMVSPGRNAFAFTRINAKVKAFMNWLGKQEDAGLLETSHALQLGEGIENAWTNVYVRSAYQKGIERARNEMKKKDKNIPTLEQTGGINVAMNGPLHADRVGVLYTRMFTELQGITMSMDIQISSILSQGLIDGLNPRQIARNMRKTVLGPTLGITDKLGRFIPAARRAETLARTEIIRAHHTGMMQEYKNWGVVGVRVMAEWVTAQDDRVCEDCADMEGKIFTIEAIEARIPLHPNCRCVAIPVDVT